MELELDEVIENLEYLVSDSCTDTQFDYIEEIEIATKSLKKQIPMKPIKSEEQSVRYVNTYYCPVCRLGITGTNIAKWCYHCGQKLDWRGDNETDRCR